MNNENRDKIIDGLVDSYKEKLMIMSNYKIIREVFNNMNCTNCPLNVKGCDLMTCIQATYKFIGENEV